MKIDFHTHGKLAKKLPFSKEYTDLLFQKARKKGLDAICLTEHFNTLSFRDMYNYIYNEYEHLGDGCQTKDGLFIFFGMEVDIAEGGHTLVIGRYQDIISLNCLLDDYKQKGCFLPFDRLCELVKSYDVLFGGAHPFRQGSHIPELSLEQLNQFDFFDLNGKDLSCNQQQTEMQVSSLATYCHKPVVAGSDTHQATQYGCVMTCFENNMTTLNDLKNEIKNQKYTITIADSLTIQVEDATIQKRLLKEVYKLGGNYVALLD